MHYYGYGALGTDRYPPFTLADVPDYPAHLDVPYPERLSRGLVLVKWWLLALPHYVVVAVFVGGGIWFGTGADGRWDDGWGAGGLVGLLVFVAGVVLLFAGRYPRGLYDFVLGMDRWVLRVAAYAALMTDAYPPFRMDMGGSDPGSLPTGPLPAGPGGGGAVHPVTGPVGGPSGAVAAGGRTRGGWPAGRIVTLVIGSVLLATATGFVGAGGAVLWADQTQRDDDGWLVSPDAELSGKGYAVTTDGFLLEGDGLDWVVDDLIGTARIEVTSRTGSDLFIGLGRTSDVETYLDGVGRSVLDDLAVSAEGERDVLRGMTDVAGGPPATPPGDADVWVASATGSGTQVLDWRPTEGDWTVVVMRADGAAGIQAEVRAGATLPGLTWFSWVLIGIGGVIALAGGLLVALAVRGARQVPPPGGQPAEQLPPIPPAPPAGVPAPVLSGGPSDGTPSAST
ncbi:DUF4389 domain-containing protein [Blastococcus sp. URHD0036]|uniref:DUF4389 domain-containing protein n=1 Tax=Blastococcus sp. URHD0036 TaxID=1380356 RepID=UPI001E39CD16|nr:DUF4389 domain-containing protein [Blastococcus sp. URHD0036]